MLSDNDLVQCGGCLHCRLGSTFVINKGLWLSAPIQVGHTTCIVSKRIYAPPPPNACRSAGAFGISMQLGYTLQHCVQGAQAARAALAVIYNITQAHLGSRRCRQSCVHPRPSCCAYPGGSRRKAQRANADSRLGWRCLRHKAVRVCHSLVTADSGLELVNGNGCPRFF
jgi:hypothetical protein